MSREMKDSGIAWIGDIPKEWEVCPIRRIMRNRSERNQPNAEVLSLYRDWGIVPKNSRDDNHNVTSEDTTNYKVVHKGDFVINKMKAWQGSMAVSDYDGIISPAYYVCYFTNDNVNKRYIHHLLRNESYKTEYMRLSSGLRVGQWDLNIENFLRIPMVLPSLPEQQKIADYLDKVCCEVDDLVALQETMIEELKAYKQSVITEAVTKGLNPNAPMKDSGIDWIGEIPEGWEICRIKNGIEFNPRCEISVNEDNAVSYMPMECLRNGKIERREAKYGQVSQLTYFANNDIVMAKVTPCFENGNIAVADNLINGIGFGSSELFVIRCKETVYKEFMFYYLQSSYIVNSGVSTMTGTGGLKRVNPTLFQKFILLRPPLSEQRTIASYLDGKCSEIDSLIALKQEKIEELKEYKKSVIYEYVTGKKEVA